MKDLAPRHPVRLAVGSARILGDLAQRIRNSAILIWAEKGEQWAREAAGVDSEIARDAGNGELLVDEVARDGVITPTEAAQLRRHFSEIGTEAREGRIV